MRSNPKIDQTDSIGAASTRNRDRESIIETGVIREKSIHTPALGTAGPIQIRYQMEFLDLTYLDPVMELQSIIVANLYNPDLLQPFGYDFMGSHFGSQGRVIGVLSEKHLIGFRAIYFPEVDDREWNLGYDVGLSKTERARLANLQMVCVHPLYRGNRLAIKMNTQAIQFLKEKTDHIHLLATVHPENIWNIRILLNCGFIIRNLKYKYAGKLRFIVYQNLRESYKYPNDEIPRKLIELGNIEAQKQILNDGFVGIDLIESKRAKHVLFVKGSNV